MQRGGRRLVLRIGNLRAVVAVMATLLMTRERLVGAEYRRGTNNARKDGSMALISARRTELVE